MPRQPALQDAQVSGFGIRDRYDLTVLTIAFSEQDVRCDKVASVRRAIERGVYRISAHRLAACLMLEMLQ